MNTYATPQQVAAARAAAVHLELEVPFGRGYDGVAVVLSRAGLTLRPLRTARDRRRLRESQTCWDCGQSPAVAHSATWFPNHTPYPACCRECLAKRRRILWNPGRDTDRTAPRPPHRRGLTDQCGAAMPAGWKVRYLRVVVDESQDVERRTRSGKLTRATTRNELVRFVLPMGTPQERHRAAGATWVAEQGAEAAFERRNGQRTRATAKGASPAPWVIRTARTLSASRWSASALRAHRIAFLIVTTGSNHVAGTYIPRGRQPWRPWREALAAYRVACTAGCGALIEQPERLFAEGPGRDEQARCGACRTTLLWDGLLEQQRRNAEGSGPVAAPPSDLSWQEEGIE